jgi:uncharacterized protein HemX
MSRAKANTNDEEKEEPVKKTKTTNKKPEKEETSVEEDFPIVKLQEIKKKELEDTMRSVVKFNISVAIVLCLAMFIFGFLLSHRISKLENAITNNTNTEESVQPGNSKEEESDNIDDNDKEEIDDSEETDTSEEDEIDESEEDFIEEDN